MHPCSSPYTIPNNMVASVFFSILQQEDCRLHSGSMVDGQNPANNGGSLSGVSLGFHVSLH